MTTLRVRLAGSLVALGLLAACGGSSTSPSGGVTVIVRDGGTTGVSGATITITGAGVSPKAVSVAVGQTVTFVNNDTRSHDMESDPHPAHTDCPSIANVGLLQPGQSKSTFGFSGSGSCGFHDHNNSDSAGLKGRIVIQ